MNAQYALGKCYIDGRGVSVSYNSAAKWFQKASDQGEPNAQYELGVCYYNGYGVKQDYDSAVNLYNKAISQGNLFAKYGLAECYIMGRGVPPDVEKAKTILLEVVNTEHVVTMDESKLAFDIELLLMERGIR